MDKDDYILKLEKRIRTLETELSFVKRFEEAVDAAGFDVWENNFETGEAIGSNEKLFKALGYTGDELPQSVDELLALVHPVDQEKAQKLIQEHFDGLTEYYRAELRIKAKDGSWVWMGNYGQVRGRNKEGVVTKFIGLNFNIDQRRIIEETMKSMAYTDELTGLSNRRKLFETAEIELEKAKRYKHPLSLIFADIDRFKLINDQFGHIEGDKILKDYAEAINQTLRKVDQKCRYGGDEFIILLPETNLDQAYQSAVRLSEVVKTMNTRIPNGITTSIGIAAFESDDTIETLIKKADTALYRSKKKGRDAITIFELK